MDDEDYEEWLDYLDKGGTTEEWNELKKHREKSIIEPEDKGDLYTSLNQLSDNLLERSLQVNNYLNTLGLPESKWSGVTEVVDDKKLPRSYGRTKANGDIWLRDDAGIKTVIHEQLHTRSVLHDMKAYQQYATFEENACEMLAEEICHRNGIRYRRTYRKETEPLRDISRLSKGYISDYDFALEYFKIPLVQREQWLVDLAEMETKETKEKILRRIEEIKYGKKS